MFDVNEEFRKAAEEIVELHTKKNENYGNSFSELFQKLGKRSGLVPLWNKLDRLTTLVSGGKGSVNHFESEEDTLKDLASCALMRLVEVRGDHKEGKEADASNEFLLS